jgi:hypothetical protein
MNKEVHGVMFLNLRPKKEESTEDFLYYMYPSVDSELTFISKLEKIKGVLITIHGVCFDIYKEFPTIVTLKENEKEEKFITSYSYLSEFLLLILILPNDHKSSKLYFQSLSNQLRDLFHFLYENPESIIEDEKNHKQLDSVFKVFFENYFQRENNLEVFLSSLEYGVSYFQSSFDLSLKISEQLNLFEGLNFST